MAVPASTEELEPFTPASLANVPVPPVFMLRAASGREVRKYEFLLNAEGLRNYSPADFRDEIRRALPSLYDAETAATSKARLETYWALCDQKAEIDPKEEADVTDFVRRATQEWRPLARMAAEVQRCQQESMRIAASMFISGWKGLDVEYRREDGVVPLAVIDDVEDQLVVIEKAGAESGVAGVLKPGTAFAQLAAACLTRLFLTKDEEKNSQSPPSSTPARNGSTKPSSSKTGGRSSKASASSESATA